LYVLRSTFYFKWSCRCLMLIYNLFTPRYSWNTAKLALNTNQSINNCLIGKNYQLHNFKKFKLLGIWFTSWFKVQIICYTCPFHVYLYETIVDYKILIQKSNEYILLYYLSSFLYNTSFHIMFLDFNLNWW
jgi:hypothetical protein